MYPWVTHTWNPLAGNCLHDCSYCYMKKRFLGTLEKYQGEARISDDAFSTDLGKGNTIFVGSATDVFGKWVPSGMIKKILSYCSRYDNTYLFQTKNPGRFDEFLTRFPDGSILATTLETNRDYNVSKAPVPEKRYFDFLKIKYPIKMISIEPVLDFDLDQFSEWIHSINPKFVSIGADSKRHNLPEPSSKKIEELLDIIKKYTNIKVKNNLRRVIELEI